MPPELQRVIEGLALQKPAPSLASIQRKVEPIARTHGWTVPSYSTIRRLVRQLAVDMMTLAQQGVKVYQDTFDLLHQRATTRPNEIWQADHSLLKIFLANMPCCTPRRRHLNQEIKTRQSLASPYLKDLDASPPSPPAHTPSTPPPRLKRYRHD